jgi:hypothetical protein
MDVYEIKYDHKKTPTNIYQNGDTENAWWITKLIDVDWGSSTRFFWGSNSCGVIVPTKPQPGKSNENKP